MIGTGDVCSVDVMLIFKHNMPCNLMKYPLPFSVNSVTYSGLILGLHLVNERQRYFVQA